MQKFNEWADKRIKLSFQEKYNMLLTRLGTLNSMKSSADSALKNSTTGYSCVGCMYTDSNKSIEELVQEVDSMWNELKKEVVSSVKAYEKAKKSKV